MLIAIVIAIVVVVLMFVGAEATKGLAPWLRIASSLVPLVVIVGTVCTFFLLAACGLADDLPPERAAVCATTSALAIPVALGYSGTAGITWFCVVMGRCGRGLQSRLVKISGAVAVTVPVAVLGAVIIINNSTPAS